MIILHLCTKSPTDMRYRVWRAETGNFRSFLNFYSPKILKNQNLEKMKKKKKSSSFYSCVQKSQSNDVTACNRQEPPEIHTE